MRFAIDKMKSPEVQELIIGPSAWTDDLIKQSVFGKRHPLNQFNEQHNPTVTAPAIGVDARDIVMPQDKIPAESFGIGDTQPNPTVLPLMKDKYLRHPNNSPIW